MNKRLQRLRGMILICTLIIMVILSVFLIVGVYRMQSSTMVTKKVIWDIKSYWSAMAGSTLASDGCIRNYRWPEEGLLKQAGSYVINMDGNKIVKAVDEDNSSSFSVYYKSKLLNAEIVSSSPSEVSLQEHFNGVALETLNSDEEKGEIYCLSVGQSGPMVCGLELVYGLYYNPNLFGKAIGEKNIQVNQSSMQKSSAVSAAAAIYVQNNLNAKLKELFQVKQDNGTRGCIVVGGNVEIEGGGGKCDPYGNGPLSIEEGAIFLGGNLTSDERNLKINGTDIKPDVNSNVTNYSFPVFTSPKVQVQTPKFNEIKNQIPFPNGMFCFVEMPNKYEQDEFDETVQTLLDVSLTPKEFYDIYAKDLIGENNNSIYTDKINEYNATLTEKFSTSDIERFDKTFETYFAQSEQEIKDANRKTGLFAFLKEDEKIDSVKQLYRIYLLSQCLTILDKYKSDDGKSKYESFFIPDGNAGITDTADKISLKYKTFAKARSLGIIAKYAINKTPASSFIAYLSSSSSNSLLDKFATESDKIKDHFESYKNKNNSSTNPIYIAEEVENNSNKCFVLNKISEYNIKSSETYKSQNAKDIAEVLKNVIFESDDTDLIMSVNCNLKSDSGSFNFATFERKDKYNGSSTALLNVHKTRLANIQPMIPVDNTTKFLRLFVKPVMAREEEKMRDADQGIREQEIREEQPQDFLDDELVLPFGNKILRPSKLIIQQLLTENPDSDYISAISRRAAVRLGAVKKAETNVADTKIEKTENSITAKSINIKGFIYGTGHICSTSGDIKFEAVGSGVDSTEENWVSIWSSNNIQINRVSATKSNDSGEGAQLSTSDFRGILYSKNDLNVDVGTDNLDFSVSGAIICGHDLKMDGIRNLIVTYDPKLSSLILSRFVSDWESNTKYIEKMLDINKKSADGSEEYINTGKFKYFNRI